MQCVRLQTPVIKNILACARRMWPLKRSKKDCNVRKLGAALFFKNFGELPNFGLEDAVHQENVLGVITGTFGNIKVRNAEHDAARIVVQSQGNL